MATSLFSAFEKFPDINAVIGRLIMGYGEIELGMLLCVDRVLVDQFSAFRALYRMRSEVNRIEISDAILYPILSDTDLAGYYGTLIGDVRLCKDIRNQYAHSHWIANRAKTKLAFTEFEPVAKSSTSQEFTFYPITLELLDRQEAFFIYCIDALYYLGSEMSELLEREDERKHPKPRRPKPPPKRNPAVKIRPRLGSVF